jgi:hypothetical protein
MGSIKDQNLLRVGYNDNYAPSCFFNKNGLLAGYEAGMAYDLAWFLGMGIIEFIPITLGNLCGALNHGTCDILMSPATVASKRLNDRSFQTLTRCLAWPSCSGMSGAGSFSA